MEIVILSEQHGYQYILAPSSIGEIERIRERLTLEDNDYILREETHRVKHKVYIKDIIAYGKIDEVSEAECRRFILTGSAKMSPGYRYKSYIPYDKENPDKLAFEIHYDARSAWNGAIIMLLYPEYGLLYRKLIKPIDDGIQASRIEVQSPGDTTT